MASVDAASLRPPPRHSTRIQSAFISTSNKSTTANRKNLIKQNTPSIESGGHIYETFQRKTDIQRRIMKKNAFWIGKKLSSLQTASQWSWNSWICWADLSGLVRRWEWGTTRSRVECGMIWDYSQQTLTFKFLPCQFEIWSQLETNYSIDTVLRVSKPMVVLALWLPECQL